MTQLDFKYSKGMWVAAKYKTMTAVSETVDGAEVIRQRESVVEVERAQVVALKGENGDTKRFYLLRENNAEPDNDVWVAEEDILSVVNAPSKLGEYNMKKEKE